MCSSNVLDELTNQSENVIIFCSFNMFCSFRYAKSVGAKHLLSSAKLNKGVDELFLELAKGELV
jgi:hypothetical protein